MSLAITIRNAIGIEEKDDARGDSKISGMQVIKDNSLYDLGDDRRRYGNEDLTRCSPRDDMETKISSHEAIGVINDRVVEDAVGRAEVSDHFGLHLEPHRCLAAIWSRNANLKIFAILHRVVGELRAVHCSSPASSDASNERNSGKFP